MRCCWDPDPRTCPHRASKKWCGGDRLMRAGCSAQTNRHGGPHRTSCRQTTCAGGWLDCVRPFVQGLFLLIVKPSPSNPTREHRSGRHLHISLRRATCTFLRMLGDSSECFFWREGVFVVERRRAGVSLIRVRDSITSGCAGDQPKFEGASSRSRRRGKRRR